MACGLALAAPVVVDAAPSGAAFPGANGKIAFQTNRDGDWEIYSMNPDGTGQTRLTNNAAADFEPAWSADGTKIAFFGTRDGNAQIYLMNADGSGQTNLSNNAAADFNPAWSPDGTQIAFSSTRNGCCEIFVMNANGTGQTRLTNSGLDLEPAWSPDGTKIAFHRGACPSDIWVMNADGTGQTRLTNTGGCVAGAPNWSPDGTHIAFAHDGFGRFHDIYVMNANGSGQTNLTNNAASGIDNSGPAWSPEGTKISFTSDLGTSPSNGEIYTMNANGSGVTRLTTNLASDSKPDWQPIVNRPPTVSAGGSYQGVEGSAISLDGTVTDPDPGDTPTTQWTYAAVSGVDAGAVCAFASAASVDTTITCTDDGLYAVTLTANDGTNPAVSDSAELTASNANPVVGAVNVTATNACAVGVSASFTDAGSNDTHDASIAWGDTGVDSTTGVTSPVTGSHTYTSAGTFTVTVEVTDDDAAMGSNSGVFTTMNRPSGILPPINADGSSNFKIGSTIPVKITVTDCGGNLVSTLGPQVTLAKVGDGDGTVNELVSSSAADTGTTMRWSATGLQYIFNLSTKNSQFNAGNNLTQGRYRLRVSDASFFGGYLEVFFDLRK
jgi:TolB protein